ncbi:hypothetical protein EUGRSUZ_H01290 [Eucalyptus grandis]|uniref:Uncharacterized protein n=2 Tax=Eucalyptus grandis TaxID=71139 RepID=A0ACC3JPT5_EUCGR|nr:hypothetical protein EUGRSUZ_H01290 [Eucalyptus grandis]
MKARFNPITWRWEYQHETNHKSLQHRETKIMHSGYQTYYKIKCPLQAQHASLSKFLFLVMWSNSKDQYQRILDNCSISINKSQIRNKTMQKY